MSRRKAVIDVRLPVGHVAFLDAVAKKAGTSRDVAFSVLMAAWLIQFTPAPKPETSDV